MTRIKANSGLFSTIGLLSLTLSACASGTLGSSTDSQDWECQTTRTGVQCTTAMATQTGERAFYVCMAGEDRAECPSPDAMANADKRVDALLSEYGSSRNAYANMPWACLLTGKHERMCERDLVAHQRGQIIPVAMDPDAAALAAKMKPSGYPEVPTTRDGNAWEEYFDGLAQWAYSKNGVDVEFPNEIWDYTKSFISSAIQGVGNNSGMSCDAAETEMRRQSWLDAVSRGFYDLNDIILNLCQIGAEYPARVGACQASGRW
ncbi:MAG: hypothetical protein AB7V46_04150 [Thermomicrobiales bacterium]